MSALSQLRHAYHQLSLGTVKDQKQFADGLIAPAIREMERIQEVQVQHVRQVQEQNTFLDKVSAELQDLCDRQAKMLAERDAAIQLMQKDAARYHWLRNTDHWPAVFPDYDEPEPLRGAELDAEIDARMGDPK